MSGLNMILLLTDAFELGLQSEGASGSIECSAFVRWSWSNVRSFVSSRRTL